MTKGRLVLRCEPAGFDSLKPEYADERGPGNSKRNNRGRNIARIPVVVLAISKVEEDVLKTNDLNVNCYIQNPVDDDEFVWVLR